MSAADAEGTTAGEAGQEPGAQAGDGEPKRKSRWGGLSEDAEEGAKKKSRWGSKSESTALTAPMGMGPGMMMPAPGGMASINPEQMKIQTRLNEIQRILALPEIETVRMDQRYDMNKGEWIEVAGGRSPSPPPVYDRMGKRSNTRDVRLRENLQKERLALVEKLMKLQPNMQNAQFAGLMQKTQVKVTNKIWVPVKEYPGYPFIGLILGPRGNTQKKLERETGARIVIRGKGSVKDGRKGYRGATVDPSEDEDLHVLISGDTQDQVDAASKVITELLQPKEDSENEWKRMQLRELAMINGTLRDDQDFFKDEMRQLARTQQGSTGGGATADAPWRLNVDKQEEQMNRDWDRMHSGGGGGAPPWQRGGGGGGPRPPQASAGGREMDGEYANFLDELSGKSGENRGGGGRGGGEHNPYGPPGGGPGQAESPYGPPGGRGGGDRPSPYGPGGGGDRPPPRRGDDLPPDCNVYVGGLPPHFEDHNLRSLFAAYGDIASCNVIRDKESGISRNFGFVNFYSPQDANTAINAVNGYNIDGKTLQVRLKGAPAPPMNRGGGGGGGPGGAPPWAGSRPPGGGPPPWGGPGGPRPPGGGGPPWGGPGGPPPPHHAGGGWGGAPPGHHGGPPPHHGHGGPPPHGAPWSGPPPNAPGYGGGPPGTDPYGPPPGAWGGPPPGAPPGGAWAGPPPGQQYGQQQQGGWGGQGNEAQWGQGQQSSQPPSQQQQQQQQHGPPGLDSEYAAFMSETS